MEEYDVAVMGAGPAGLTAAIYAGRYKLKTIVFGELYGGAISAAHKVENYPSYKSISGIELTTRFVEHVEGLGIKIVPERIEAIEKKEDGFLVKSDSTELFAKKLIMAIGTKRRLLGAPRENEFLGKGVSYCATCDGPFFKGKTVAVVGGSDSATSAAVYLADIADKVYIIHRRDSFSKAEPVWVELVNSNKKIEKVMNSNVVDLIGSEKLTGVKLDTGRVLEIDGLFIEIGSLPQKDLFDRMGIATDEMGYARADAHMKTSVYGLFTCGDVNAGNFKQAIVAAAEGAIAANTAFEEIKRETLEGQKSRQKEKLLEGI